MKLYEKFSAEIREKINHGYYHTGQKLPSIRTMSASRGVSISTVQEAYQLLEDSGILFSKPKSGYYVKHQNNVELLPDISRPEQKPVTINNWKNALELNTTSNHNGFMAFGGGGPDISLKTLKPLQRFHSEIARQQPKQIFDNVKGNGSFALRTQIVRLMQNSGCHLHADDIIPVSGCVGISITLRSFDWIACIEP